MMNKQLQIPQKQKYYLAQSSKLLPASTNNDQESLHLYFSKHINDISSMTQRNSLKNNSQLEINQSTKDQYLQKQNLASQIDGVISRTQWTKQKYPKTMNYVNLSYQKIKSLNTTSSFNFVDSVIEERNFQPKSGGSKDDDNKIRLSFIINQNFYANDNMTPSSKMVTSSNQSDQGYLNRINDDSLENNKVPLYTVQYDHNLNKNNTSQKIQEEDKDLLLLQLSPIIRRYTRDSINTNKASMSLSSDHCNFADKYFSSQNKTNNLKLDQVEGKPNYNKDLKYQKMEKLKKVKLSTEHAFHYSSGRAKLKNKRQMFSPCQSARYECKVQFENKYLIKTSFIQPNDNNKDIQMVPVDLITTRRQKLLEKLEGLQQKKQRITEQEKLEQEEREELERVKQFELILKKKSKDISNMSIQRYEMNIQETEEDGKEESSNQLDNHQQNEQSTFSQKINQLKKVDDYNIKMKGIQNQINDIEEVLVRERQLTNQSHYSNKNTTPLNRTLLGQSILQLQQSPRTPSKYANNNFIKGINQNNSNNSVLNLTNSLLNQSKGNNTSQQSISKMRKAKELQAPFCNSNQILNRYNKQNQKEKVTGGDSNRHQVGNILKDIEIHQEKAQKFITQNSIKSNDLNNSKIQNVPQTPHNDKELQNIILNLEDLSQQQNHNFGLQNGLQSIQLKAIQEISQESNFVKKSSFSVYKQDTPHSILNKELSPNQRNIIPFSPKFISNYELSPKLVNVQQLSPQQMGAQQTSPKYFKKQNTDEMTKLSNSHISQQRFQTSQKEISVKNITSKVSSKREIPETVETNSKMNIETPHENNQKKHSIDKQFLSALLSTSTDTKKHIKKPISVGFVKRRTILQKPVTTHFKHKRANMKKIRKLLLEFLQKLHQSKLQLNEFIEKKSEIFMERPLQRVGSFVFFKAVKHNNLEGVKTTLQKCRYYVFDFNAKKQTCVHITAKKGYTNMLQYLISQGADLNFKDLVGRKPLYYAIKHNNFDCVKLLLENMADPWSCDNQDYSKLAQSNEDIFNILKQFRKMHLILMFTPYQFKKTIINDTLSSI